MHTQYNSLRPEKIKPEYYKRTKNFTNQKHKVIKDYIWDAEPVLICED